MSPSGDIWVYAYYLCSSETLVVLSGSTDPIYQIYAVAGNIKAFLKRMLGKDIHVHHIRWKKVEILYHSGYYAIKQFLINAKSLKNNPADDYLQQIARGNRKFNLEGLTKNQLEQSVKYFRTILTDVNFRPKFPLWFSSND
jgi:hypothetical protein